MPTPLSPVQPPDPIIAADPPEDPPIDPFGAYSDLARCDGCGALDGISGAPTPRGGWISEVDLMDRHGFDYEQRGAWATSATAMPAPTVLAGGRCQFCRGEA